MNKILVQIIDDYIKFSLYNGKNTDDLNKTNMFDVKKIKLSDEFISNNEKQIANFINVLANDLNKVVIADSDISETILSFLKYVPNVQQVYFEYDKSLTYSECSLLYDNRYLNLINCYSLPEYLFDRFNILKKVIVQVRFEINSPSNFFKINNLRTYSNLYYKKKIFFPDKLSYLDLKDFLDFLKINMFLKEINLVSYNYKNMIDLLNLLKKNNISNIKLLIFQTDDNKEDLLKDSIKFYDIEKEFKIKIKIKYNDIYKRDNYLKQVNINLVKLFSLSLVFVSIIIINFSYLYMNKDNKNIKNINTSIDRIILDNNFSSENKILDNNNNNSLNLNEDKNSNIYYSINNESLNKLYEINNDTVGYLKVNNTQINYPVVKSLDNEFYLNHDFYKKSNSYGWIFMDYRNTIDVLDQNTIIYGHNISKDNLLFGSLKNTLEETWYKNKDNHVISFDVINKDINWKIFSVYVIDVTNDYLITNFSSKDNFDEFINKLKNRSIYDFGVDVKWGDNILTLSTCYTSSNQRVVVHAKKIN